MSYNYSDFIYLQIDQALRLDKRFNYHVVIIIDVMPLNERKNGVKTLACAKCGFELTDISYLESQKTMDVSKHTSELYCPKCRTAFLIE